MLLLQQGTGGYVSEPAGFVCKCRIHSSPHCLAIEGDHSAASPSDLQRARTQLWEATALQGGSSSFAKTAVWTIDKQARPTFSFSFSLSLLSPFELRCCDGSEIAEASSCASQQPATLPWSCSRSRDAGALWGKLAQHAQQLCKPAANPDMTAGIPGKLLYPAQLRRAMQTQRRCALHAEALWGKLSQHAQQLCRPAANLDMTAGSPDK